MLRKPKYADKTIAKDSTHKIKAFDAYRTSVHVGVVTGGEVWLSLKELL